MKKLIAITIAAAIMLGSIPLQAADAPATGVKGSINRTWEAGKVLLGAVLLLPGFTFGVDGSLKVINAYRTSQSSSNAGLLLGTGVSSLIVGIALMESGFRNLREARRHKK